MDETDRRIVLSLLRARKTVSELAEDLYPDLDKWKLHGKASFLRYRLHQLQDAGLVAIDPDPGGTYGIPLDQITDGRAELVVKKGAGRMVTDLGRVLVTDRNGTRHMLFLDR